MSGVSQFVVVVSSVHISSKMRDLGGRYVEKYLTILLTLGKMESA